LKLTPIRQAIVLGLYGATAFALAPNAFAQVQSTPAASADTGIQSVNIVGSRRVGNTSSTDTPVPVDYIPMTKAAEQGSQFDLAQTLTNISPSFNSTRQSGADGADLVDSAALRGLGSDQTLVLVNGKRRHTTALVNLFGARNRGNTGTDMNAIPLLAIKQRAGAARRRRRPVRVRCDRRRDQHGTEERAWAANRWPAAASTRRRRQELAGLGLLRHRRGGGVLGITGEYLRPRPLEPRRCRQPAHHRRHQESRTKPFTSMANSRSARASCT
jgi:hypothetical protein